MPETIHTIDRIADKVVRGGRITSDEALTLWGEAPLSLLGELAVGRKRARSGDAVYFNRNIHIEPTNICLYHCLFCSYHKSAGDPQAWDFTPEGIERIARSHAPKNPTEVHITGGVHPAHDLALYEEIVRRVKRVLPTAAVKAFTATELAYVFRKSEVSVGEGLARLKSAGLDAIPGGGAEIFDATVRRRIAPDKGSAQDWLSVHEAAHHAGLTSNATMLYGHVEEAHHRIDHMERLRALQDRTGGFNAFIPLKFRSAGNEMSSVGEVSVTDDMRTLSLSRIFLDNFPHIKAYWPMYGKVTAEIALAFGADDIDGTIENTTRIYSMAGAEEQNPSMSVDELRAMASAAGFRAVERDTFYHEIP